MQIHEIYSAMLADQPRNDLIIGDVRKSLQEKRSPLVLTERKEHLRKLAEQLTGIVRNIIVLHGGMKTCQRQELMKKLSSIPDNEERLIIATGRYLGEGFDDARLDTLFLAMPISWRGTLAQYAGRLHRGYHSRK
ncbi:MAG: helicase-related protein [Candidatus Omnitrophota bacterium]